MFGTTLIIVWREGVEALLVIGILQAWLRNTPAAAGAGRYLWSGVGAGCCAAILLAILLFHAEEFMSDVGQDYLQAGMMAAASVLIVQMVFWMRRHGATQRRAMQATLSARLQRRDWWSLFVLAAVAIAREGSETVVFLYGVGSARSGAALYGLAGGAIAGALLAGGTFWLLQYGSRVMSWRLFFRVTEIMLVVLAGALVIGAIDRLVSIDALPALKSQLWDSSAALEDDALGGMASSLLGYRARPSLTALLSYGLYWAIVGGLLYRSRRGASIDAALGPNPSASRR